ncbi:MAG: hypothetical protein ABEK59_08995 [Halobacteria archaeon]
MNFVEWLDRFLEYIVTSDDDIYSLLMLSGPVLVLFIFLVGRFVFTYAAAVLYIVVFVSNVVYNSYIDGNGRVEL